MKRSSSILLVSGDELATNMLARALSGRGYLVSIAATAQQALTHVNREGADLLVLCLPVRGLDAAVALSELKKADPNLDVIVGGTSHDLEPTTAFDLGAFEYVARPVENTTALLSAVGVALGSRRGDVQLRYLRQKDAEGVRLDGIIGTHASMQSILRVVRHVCARTINGTAPTIFLLGETGTGKGLLAKCIHYNGVRRSQPFVEVNCAAIPASLIESELFGYERGAFTDAKSSRAGLFETADGGTLFLDEIGSLPLDVQAKLLTAIDEKRVRRIGARQAAVVDVQILAACHPVLKEQVRRGEFREDLYHRLNVLSLKLPPLRDRGDDKVRLARSFIAEFCRKYGMPPRELGESAREHIMSHPWPGNVRELRNQIERIVLISNDQVLEAHHFDRQSSVFPPASTPQEQQSSAPPPTLTLPPEGMPLDALECEAIRQALERCGGNVSRAARFLSVTRQTLIYRMKKHGICLSPRRPREPLHHREDGGMRP